MRQQKRSDQVMTLNSEKDGSGMLAKQRYGRDPANDVPAGVPALNVVMKKLTTFCGHLCSQQLFSATQSPH
jgi:hypothetical protein